MPRQLRKYIVISILFAVILVIIVINITFTFPAITSYHHDVQASLPIVKYFNSSVHVIYQLPPVRPYRGLVFVAHACTHGAYDFWHNSSSCPHCVGLTEEVSIIKRIIASGYVAVAASSSDRVYKCWQGPGGKDIEVIPNVLYQIRKELNLLQSPAFALGCSSGGPFVWLLALRGFVDGVIVQSFSIGASLLSAAAHHPFPVTFNPMPKDKHTYAQVLGNIAALQAIDFPSDLVQVSPCGELEVTVGYLVSRLGDLLSESDVVSIREELLASGYVDATSNLLVKDPTVRGGADDWRQVLTRRLQPQLLQKLDFTQGRSPLAKTLNRAWAFHEYCADYIEETLEWLLNRSHAAKLNFANIIV